MIPHDTRFEISYTSIQACDNIKVISSFQTGTRSTVNYIPLMAASRVSSAALPISSWTAENDMDLGLLVLTSGIEWMRSCCLRLPQLNGFEGRKAVPCCSCHPSMLQLNVERPIQSKLQCRTRIWGRPVLIPHPKNVHIYIWVEWGLCVDLETDTKRHHVLRRDWTMCSK